MCASCAQRMKEEIAEREKNYSTEVPATFTRERLRRRRVMNSRGEIVFEYHEAKQQRRTIMGRKKKQTVSEYANALADKHNLNVTLVRDILEDVRRDVHERTSDLQSTGQYGIDLYRLLRRSNTTCVRRLANVKELERTRASRRRAVMTTADAPVAT